MPSRLAVSVKGLLTLDMRGPKDQERATTAREDLMPDYIRGVLIARGGNSLPRRPIGNRCPVNRRISEVDRRVSEVNGRISETSAATSKRLENLESEMGLLRHQMAALNVTFNRGSFAIVASVLGVIAAILAKGG